MTSNGIFKCSHTKYRLSSQIKIFNFNEITKKFTLHRKLHRLKGKYEKDTQH